jgi:hypothetical protein
MTSSGNSSAVQYMREVDGLLRQRRCRAAKRQQNFWGHDRSVEPICLAEAPVSEDHPGPASGVVASAELDQRTPVPDQCLHSAETDVRPPEHPKEELGSSSLMVIRRSRMRLASQYRCLDLSSEWT